MSLPHEVTNKALSGGYRKAIATRIGVSDSTCESWCVAPKDLDGNGLKSPVQRVIEIQLELAAGGHPDPYAILRYICRELGFMPPVKNDAIGDPTALDLPAQATKEFGEMLAAIGVAQSDGFLSAGDAEKILSEGEHLYLTLAPFFRAMHRVITEDEEARVRERRGPKRALPKLMQLRRAV